MNAAPIVRAACERLQWVTCSLPAVYHLEGCFRMLTSRPEAKFRVVLYERQLAPQAVSRHPSTSVARFGREQPRL
jgi:hypothetical protein